MVIVSTGTERRSGVTYVTATVDNRIDDPVVGTHRVRLRTDLHPIWAPNATDRPDWEEGTATVDVPVGDSVGVGFATPATASSNPIRVADVQPAEAESECEPASPRAILQALGEPRPPREAVPDTPAEVDCEDCSRTNRNPGNPSRTNGHPGETGGNESSEPGAEAPLQTGSGRAVGNGQANRDRQSVEDDQPTPNAQEIGESGRPATGGRAPAPVERWLARVEARTDGEEDAGTEADLVHLRRVERKVEILLDRVAG